MTELEVTKAWDLIKLGDLTENIYGYTAKSHTEPHGTPFIRITDITDDGHLKPNRVYVDIDEKTFQRYRLERGDILIARSGSVGRSFLFDLDDDYVFASYLIRFRPDQEKIFPRFLMYVLKSELFLSHVDDVKTISAITNVNAKNLANFQFMLPSIKIQKKIAHHLDNVLKIVSEKQQKIFELHNNSNYISLINQSKLFLLKDGFKGNLTKNIKIKENASELIPETFNYKILNLPPLKLIPQYKLPNGYVWTTIEKIANVVRGASPRPAGDPRYFGGTTPWITVNSITKDDGMYLFNGNGFLTEEGKKRSRFVNSGTLLLTNSGATLGVPKITKIAGCFNDGVAALLDLKSPTKEYLYYYLRMLTDMLRKINQGAAQPNLNTTIIKSIPIPLAPLEHQKELIKIFDKQLNALDNTTISITKTLDNKNNILKSLPTLKTAIINKAFSAKLLN